MGGGDQGPAFRLQAACSGETAIELGVEVAGERVARSLAGQVRGRRRPLRPGDGREEPPGGAFPPCAELGQPARGVGFEPSARSGNPSVRSQARPRHPTGTSRLVGLSCGAHLIARDLLRQQGRRL